MLTKTICTIISAASCCAGWLLLNEAPVTDKQQHVYENWYPHPYLGHVVREGKHNHPNGNGFLGRSIPLMRDEKCFSILMTGGCVSQWVTNTGLIEKTLNERYEFGKPVVVLNGAVGGWRQPCQTNLLALYGDCIDAIVTLDGFNEFRSIENHNMRLGYPGNTPFYTMNNAGASTSQTVESFFQFPTNWNDPDRSAYNLNQYLKFMRLMHAMCGSLGIREAHLIQPCPAIGKTLTKEERDSAGLLEYGEEYQRMTHALISLNDEQVPVASLLDCFSNTRETVYVDNVHNNDAGKAIMAERIATELARLWNIPPKENPAD